MKKVFFLALTLFIVFNSFSQGPGMQRMQGQVPSGRFYGKIVDVTNKGIEAASVTLVQTKMDTATKKPVEVIAGGMLTTKSGDFSIENVPVFGKYTLRVTGIGFKSYDQPVTFTMPGAMNPNDQASMLGALDKDLGNIKLELDEQVLGGVTITASRPSITMGIDRKIFNVDRNLTSAGGTAIDVMRNVPTLNVDIDGNVTLRNASPQIFVDGRPTNLTLDQIPADAIETVEVITNPSAKFDASGGTAGILNITLKKNKRVGYSGSVRVNLDSRGRVGGGGDFNIREDKINFFGSGMLHNRKTISDGFTDRTNFGRGDTAYNFLQTDRSIGLGRMGFGRVGFDFFLDNRNTITVNTTFQRGRMRPNMNSDIELDTTAAGYLHRGFQNRVSNSDFNFRNNGGQVSFKHLFPKAGHEITADVTVNKSRNSSENDINTDFFSMPVKTLQRSYNQFQRGSGTNEFIVVQTDYSNPITDKSKIELGARATQRTVNSANQFFTRTQNGALVPTAANIIFNSTDKVYAAYATFTNRINNFGYQLGLRGESSDYFGDVPTKNQTFNIKFPISLFPNVFLTQKLTDMEEIQLNYSRKINRPNFFQLFPFIDSSDIVNVSVGNPGLRPEFTNSIELSYSKTFKNRDNFLASLYYKNTTDLITRYQGIDTAISKFGIVNTFINANSSYVTGLELISRNKITKIWDLTSNVNLFTAKIEVPNQPSQDQFPSYFIKINNSFKLPHNITLQLSGDYQSKIISNPVSRGGGGFGGGGGMFGGPSSAAQGFIRPNYGVDAALRMEFLKNKTASVSLNVNDIFRTKLFDAHSENEFFVQDIQRRRDPQVFRLNFNYRFGKFDAALFKRKNTRADGNVDMSGMGQ